MAPEFRPQSQFGLTSHRYPSVSPTVVNEVSQILLVQIVEDQTIDRVSDASKPKVPTIEAFEEQVAPQIQQTDSSSEPVGEAINDANSNASYDSLYDRCIPPADIQNGQTDVRAVSPNTTNASQDSPSLDAIMTATFGSQPADWAEDDEDDVEETHKTNSLQVIVLPGLDTLQSHSSIGISPEQQATQSVNDVVQRHLQLSDYVPTFEQRQHLTDTDFRDPPLAYEIPHQSRCLSESVIIDNSAPNLDFPAPPPHIICVPEVEYHRIWRKGSCDGPWTDEDHQHVQLLTDASVQKFWATIPADLLSIAHGVHDRYYELLAGNSPPNNDLVHYHKLLAVLAPLTLTWQQLQHDLQQMPRTTPRLEGREAELKDPETEAPRESEDRLVHHVNFTGDYIHERSATSPATSFWAMNTTRVNHISGSSRRKRVLTAQAFKYVDPVQYLGGAGDAPKFWDDESQRWVDRSGTDLQESVIGEVQTVYQRFGTWGADTYNVDDDIPGEVDENDVYHHGGMGGYRYVPRPVCYHEEDFPTRVPKTASSKLVPAVTQTAGPSPLRGFSRPVVASPVSDFHQTTPADNDAVLPARTTLSTIGPIINPQSSPFPRPPSAPQPEVQNVPSCQGVVSQEDTPAVDIQQPATTALAPERLVSGSEEDVSAPGEELLEIVSRTTEPTGSYSGEDTSVDDGESTRTVPHAPDSPVSGFEGDLPDDEDEPTQTALNAEESHIVYSERDASDSEEEPQTPPGSPSRSGRNISADRMFAGRGEDIIPESPVRNSGSYNDSDDSDDEFSSPGETAETSPDQSPPAESAYDVDEADNDEGAEDQDRENGLSLRLPTIAEEDENADDSRSVATEDIMDATYDAAWEEVVASPTYTGETPFAGAGNDSTSEDYHEPDGNPEEGASESGEMPSEDYREADEDPEEGTSEPIEMVSNEGDASFNREEITAPAAPIADLHPFSAVTKWERRLAAFSLAAAVGLLWYRGW